MGHWMSYNDLNDLMEMLEESVSEIQGVAKNLIIKITDEYYQDVAEILEKHLLIGCNN